MTYQNTQISIRIPLIALFLLATIISVGISYLITREQRNKDRQLIEKIIDELFHGKNEICDYYKSPVNGTLTKALTSSKSVIVDDDFFIKPDIPDTSAGGETNFWYQQQLEKWNSSKDIVDYYKSSSGGFTVLTLTKKINGYDLVESESKNMAYKVPAFRRISRIDYGYGVTEPAHDKPTYRPSPQMAYDEAMEYLSSDNENKAYTEGKYGMIKAFDEIGTDFHYIDNVQPTKISASSVNSISWKGNGASVFNNQWIVWYDTKGLHYEIVENKKEFKKRWITYSSIGSILSLIIYLIFKYRKRLTIEV